jgi:hypothetical protein
MKFYGITMEGKFINQKVTADVVLPDNFDAIRDTGRVVYNQDDGYLWWGDGIDLKWRRTGTGDGGGDGSEAEDMYSDLLLTSIFKNASWDEYREYGGEDWDVLLNKTTSMYPKWNSDYTWFEYSNGDVLESLNLFDARSFLNAVSHIMASVDYIQDDAAPLPTIQATANGGTTWFTVDPHKVYSLGDTDAGSDLRIRFIAKAEGVLKSWAMYYNKDLSVSCAKNALTSYTETIGVAKTTVTVPEGYVPNAVMVYLNGDLMHDSDYIAADGSDIIFNAPQLQVGDIVRILSFGTSVLGSGGGGGSTGPTVDWTYEILKAIMMGTYSGDYYIEYTFNASDLPTNIDVWPDSNKVALEKIATITITYDVNDMPDVITYEYRDSVGDKQVVQDYEFDANELPTSMTQTTSIV